MAWRELIGGVPVGGGGFRIKNPKAGFPDLSGVFKGGRLFAIEVKSKTGKLDPKQKVWLADLEKMGCFVMVARSLDEVIEAMTEEIKCLKVSTAG